MAHKYPAIDLLDLYAKSNTDEWNAWLSLCLKTHNIQELKRVRYGIQVGMSNLAKQKLNDEKISVFFIRLNRSIEHTAKHILRILQPNPLDNPRSDFKTNDQFARALDMKRKRDDEFERFLRESSY